MHLPLLYLRLTSATHAVQFESITPSLSWVVKILNSCSRMQTNLRRVSLLITDPKKCQNPPTQKRKKRITEAAKHQSRHT